VHICFFTVIAKPLGIFTRYQLTWQYIGFKRVVSERLINKPIYIYFSLTSDTKKGYYNCNLV